MTPSADPFVPAPLLAGGHRMTLYAWARRRRFPALPPAEARYFPIGADTQVLGHCHWQADRGAPTVLLLHGLEGSSDSHQYVLVTAGFEFGEEGTFTNTIDGPGAVTLGALGGGLPDPVPQPNVIPTNTGKSLGLMAVLLSLVGFAVLRRRGSSPLSSDIQTTPAAAGVVFFAPTARR